MANALDSNSCRVTVLIHAPNGLTVPVLPSWLNPPAKDEFVCGIDTRPIVIIKEHSELFDQTLRAVKDFDYSQYGFKWTYNVWVDPNQKDLIEKIERTVDPIVRLANKGAAESGVCSII